MRLDLKTGFICNNNCYFCVQAENKFKGNRPFEELKKDIDDGRKKGCTQAVITGGECSIRPDFFEVLSYCRDTGYDVIQVQSNGRMCSSMDFARKAVESGMTELAPALHGYTPEQHDYLTRAKGSFAQTVKSIQNVRELGLPVISNTVIVKPNYQNAPQIARLLVKLGVTQYQLAFVHAMGNAYKNFDAMVPRMSLAAPYIRKGLQVGIDAGINVMAEAVPICLLPGYERYASEFFIPQTMIRGKKEQNTDDFTSQRRNLGKIKFPKCKKCKWDKVCEGPWREYPEKRGDEEFQPVLI